ncbi:UNVERIFIED_CONTAM: hypothetical protein NCL1_20966 [Trichonephila clavipes]
MDSASGLPRTLRIIGLVFKIIKSIPSNFYLALNNITLNGPYLHIVNNIYLTLILYFVSIPVLVLNWSYICLLKNIKNEIKTSNKSLPTDSLQFYNQWCSFLKFYHLKIFTIRVLAFIVLIYN